MREDPSSSRSPRSDQGSKGICPQNENLAESAAAYLARSGASVQIFSTDPREIDRQANCLVEWAREHDALLPDSFTNGLKEQSDPSAEHWVFYRSSDSRAIKRTKPGMFGIIPDAQGQPRAATPLFYLRRIVLFNREFPQSDLSFEGVALGKSLVLFAPNDQPSIVVSQPWFRGKDPENPNPSPAQVEEFLTRFGFERVKKAYYGWQRKTDGVTILDAREDNFILTSEGVVPIDLVMADRMPEA